MIKKINKYHRKELFRINFPLLISHFNSAIPIFHFSVLHPYLRFSFTIAHCSFPIAHSSFFISHSLFLILHSSFPISHSLFSTRYSLLYFAISWLHIEFCRTLYFRCQSRRIEVSYWRHRFLNNGNWRIISMDFSWVPLTANLGNQNSILFHSLTGKGYILAK